MEYEIMDRPEAEGAELSIGNDQLLQMARYAEERFDAINTIMRIALRVTTPLDWVNIGGKPYLQETGASKIATALGVSVEVMNSKKVYDEDKSGHYAYHYDMRLSFASMKRDATGMRSTNDEFFIGKKDATMRLPDGSIAPKPQKKPQDVNERDVKIAAYTNCLNNGIKRIVPGLRGVTVEHLREAGIAVDKMSGYGFNSNQPTAMSDEAASQRAEIERMLKEEHGDNWQSALEHYTSFTGKDGSVVPGVKDINRLSEKRVAANYGRIKKLYEEWRAKSGKPQDANKASPQSESKPPADNNLISEKQAKRIYAIAGGDEELIKEVLAAYDYASSKDVRRSDYQAICEEIEMDSTGGNNASG